MNRTVLVVDQQPQVVATVSSALKTAAYYPLAVHAFPDAVRALRVAKPAVVIVSVELGAYNGLHLLLRSSAVLPATKVIVVGPPSAGLAAEARAMGAAAYLSRPVTPETLVEQVHVLAAWADEMPVNGHVHPGIVNAHSASA
jgi:DNA-binding NtrC family response regulator